MRRIDLTRAQAARAGTIRDINRQIVLNYVREREPISRADIARETALQRSTVSTIVDALQADGLIEEIGAGESTGGRRPTLLRIRTSGVMAIGVDIAPSQTIVATSNLAGRVLEQEKFPTDPEFRKTITRVVDCVREMARKYSGLIEAVGVSLPGLVDTTMSRVIYVPYFKWRDIEIAEIIADATGLDVTVENDANAAALAELWFGRPEVSQVRDFVMVLVAEGIGTGIVFDGQIYKGRYSAAGEFGHMIIGPEAPVACSCGNYDCWEAFSSERAALSRHRMKANEKGQKPALDFSELVERAMSGEGAAEESLLETAHYLGIGISNLIVGFSPEAVIVGGRITRAWPLVAETLSETVERSIRRGLPSARIMPSTLGDPPTLMGALSLVLANKFASAPAA
ncbi:MAG TPA: ROK family transcriptional regulator [Pyrinomonadaceae bacterium]|nr:ROK family transcriptional regulator [Pyrinomonadaceae bacterium]